MANIERKLSKVVTRAMERFNVPGAAIGITHGEEEIVVCGGITCIDFPMPIDDHTMFQIGSTTKTYTATVIMMLVEEGLVDLDAPVRRYLPGFRLADEATAEAATVKHLLTHTGGWIGDYFDDLGRGADALRRIVGRMRSKTPQITPLGTVWAYNNSGFYVAGRLIEVVTGKPYETVVAERIFEPLGMDHTFFFPEDVMTYKAAIGHVWLADGSLRVARPWGLSRASNPAGGIVSTVRDQMTYARFHLGNGAVDGTRLLAAGTARLMRKEHAPAGSMADAVGLSWLLERVGGVQVAKHGGSVNGHMSEFLLVPAKRFGLTVLTNGSRGHELGNEVIEWALREVLGVHAKAPTPRPLAARAAAEYVGRYQSHLAWWDITAEGDGLLQTYGIPQSRIDANPEIVNEFPPPLPLAAIGRDRFVVTGPFTTGARREFLRGDDGRVAWLRTHGRVYKRQDS